MVAAGSRTEGSPSGGGRHGVHLDRIVAPHDPAPAATDCLERGVRGAVQPWQNRRVPIPTNRERRLAVGSWPGAGVVQPAVVLRCSAVRSRRVPRERLARPGGLRVQRGPKGLPVRSRVIGPSSGAAASSQVVANRRSNEPPSSLPPSRWGDPDPRFSKSGKLAALLLRPSVSSSLGSRDADWPGLIRVRVRLWADCRGLGEGVLDVGIVGDPSNWPHRRETAAVPLAADRHPAFR